MLSSELNFESNKHDFTNSPRDVNGGWSNLEKKKQILGEKFNNAMFLNPKSENEHMRRGLFILRSRSLPFGAEFQQDYPNWEYMVLDGMKQNDVPNQVSQIPLDVNFDSNNTSANSDATLSMNLQNDQGGNINLGFDVQKSFHNIDPNRHMDSLTSYEDFINSRKEPGVCDCSQCFKMSGIRFEKDPFSHPLVININSDCLPHANGDIINKYINLKPKPYNKPYYPKRQMNFAKFPLGNNLLYPFDYK